MKRWPVKAEVCLEAGKRASRGKTKRVNGRKTGRKGRKKRLRDDIELESEVFPQPLQSCRKCNKKRRALAPEGCISLISPQNRSFFASCLAPERCSPSISPEIPSFSAACKARTLQEIFSGQVLRGWVPHRADRSFSFTQRWFSRVVLYIRQINTVFVLSHPSHRNKDVARVGHPYYIS